MIPCDKKEEAIKNIEKNMTSFMDNPKAYDLIRLFDFRELEFGKKESN